MEHGGACTAHLDAGGFALCVRTGDAICAFFAACRICNPQLLIWDIERQFNAVYLPLFQQRTCRQNTWSSLVPARIQRRRQLACERVSAVDGATQGTGDLPLPLKVSALKRLPRRTAFRFFVRLTFFRLRLGLSSVRLTTSAASRFAVLPTRGQPRAGWLKKGEVARLALSAWRYRQVQKGKATDRRSLQHIARIMSR